MLNQQKWSSPEKMRLASKPFFQLEQVSVHYGDFHALKSIDLQIFPKEILFVTGASGAGKSSLLHLLAGELNSSGGKVKRPQDYYPQTFTSVVFQDLRLFPARTAEENILMSFDTELHDNENQFKQEMVEYARAIGAYDHLNKKIGECNGGMKQKMALLRALMSKPDVLLADEPTAALDRDSTYKVFELLNYLNVRRGMTLVWATHNKELIKQFPGKTVHLDHGKLIFAGNACFI
jgi:ABC-type lipoprotein export system ATPase subunit